MTPTLVLVSRQLGKHNLDISNGRVLLHLVFDNGVIGCVGIPVQDVQDVTIRTPGRAPVDPADLCLLLAVPLVNGEIALSANGRVRPPARRHEALPLGRDDCFVDLTGADLVVFAALVEFATREVIGLAGNYGW